MSFKLGNVTAGKLGKIFSQDPTRPMDMRASAKGNLTGKAEKRLSRIVPTNGKAWGGGYEKPKNDPPSSANWRSTSRAMPRKK